MLYSNLKMAELGRNMYLVNYYIYKYSCVFDCHCWLLIYCKFNAAWYTCRRCYTCLMIFIPHRPQWDAENWSLFWLGIQVSWCYLYSSLLMQSEVFSLCAGGPLLHGHLLVVLFVARVDWKDDKFVWRSNYCYSLLQQCFSASFSLCVTITNRTFAHIERMNNRNLFFLKLVNPVCYLQYQ